MDLRSWSCAGAASILGCFLCAVVFSEGSRAVSQSPSKPIIFLDIPRWEDRTTHPRFIQFRDHLRRRVDDISEDISSEVIPSKSQSAIPVQLIDFSHNADSSELSSAIETPKGFKTINATESKRNLEDANEKRNSSSLNSFITSHQRQIIFPKDRTNPHNRLQIYPEDVESENNGSQETTVRSSRESLEVGNRNSFMSTNMNLFTDDLEGTPHGVRDAVPTFDLAMAIVKQSKWEDENAVFSPFSVATVLSMLMLGAEGKTLEELSSYLVKAENSDLIDSMHTTRYHDTFRKLLEYLQISSGADIKLSIASQIFTDSHFPVEQVFKYQLRQYYDAPLESIDFAKNGRSFQDSVNRWVREKTNNKIKNIMDEPPSSQTALGIVNAIYFKGPWETPFSERLTRWRDFHVTSGETVKAQMMLNFLQIPYIEREHYRMIGIPYKQNHTGFFVILPKGTDGLNDLKKVERELNRQELNESLALMKPTKVSLTLPKFKFSSDGGMHEILQGLGLTSMFGPSADFSRISTKGLYISSLLHRAVVEVNEMGTEAAAASLGTGDRIIDDVSFSCNKPFIFFIYHVHADTVLFWGRVTRPDII